MRRNILELIKEKRLYFDGGTGTVLQAEGLAPGESPEIWNITHPDKVVALHAGYLAAGSNIIDTNTFGANRLKFQNYEEIIRAAVKNASDALVSCGRDDVYMALDIGPSGRMIEPLGDYPYEDAISLFKEEIEAGLSAQTQRQPDIILIETMNDSIETKAAVLAAKETCNLPVFVTNVYDEHATLMTGASPEAMVAMLEGLGVDALGMNCSLGPAQMVDIVPRFARVSSTPIIVNPNAGLPKVVDGRTIYDVGADDFAGFMKQIAENGATILGGCCGTTPEYIQKEIAATKNLPYSLPTEKNLSVVSSFTHAVFFGGKTVLIGERINPTGKKRFKQALVEKDLNYIMEEGLKQQKAGADVLDVNVGLPEIDEPVLMHSVVSELQSLCDLPLQIDTGDAAAMERALRIYNGKPMINSVNGKKEIQDAVFPLAKKYGGLVVGLTIDEDGVPTSAEKRVAIARQIVERAAEFGIAKKDIIIDPLAMTVSADDQSGRVTLEAVRRITEELGVLTSLGVSNVSFGLPDRPALNGAFFTMAMANGLSAAIMNPFSEEMMAAYHTFNALSGRDPMCMDYIAHAAKAEGAKQKTDISAFATQAANAAASAAANAVLAIAGGTPIAPSVAGVVAGVTGTGAWSAVAGGQKRNDGASADRPGAAGSGNDGLVGTGKEGFAGGSGTGAEAAGAASPADPRFSGLQDAIEKGLKDRARTEAQGIIAGGAAPLDLVNQAVIPALNVVGDGFEKKTLFLPNLLMAAEAAQAAFGVIRDEMAKSPVKQEAAGKIVIATVQGDVHDIGKNIVKVILENYGFAVTDLGKDVPPETVVAAVKETGAGLVGLSALMTTTVPAMEKTIELLHQETPGVKVMVGGAVMNEEYAAMIHADFYGKDAMASVRYAQEVLK